jgi:hypothetical protein
MLINKGWVMYLSERSADNAIGFHVDNKLQEDDVKRYRKITEGTIAQYGNINLLFAFDNLSKAEPQAVWEDLRFSVQYKNDIKRLALVGDESLEEWADQNLEPVRQPEVRYFPPESYDEAWDWVKEDKTES